MRKNFGVKPWFYPLPVLIVGSYDENGQADAMKKQLVKQLKCQVLIEKIYLLQQKYGFQITDMKKQKCQLKNH